MPTFFKLLTVAWLTIAQVLLGVNAAVAQSFGGEVDSEPPLIEHDIITHSEAADRQIFTATVVDDGVLDSVIFYYRFEGDTDFTRQTMTPVSDTSTFIAQIPTESKAATSIEYYLQASDRSGNRTVRGYVFNPLIRHIAAYVAPENGSNDASVVGDLEGENSRSGISKTLYVLGGVLLLGLIAGAASSSSTPPGDGPVSTSGGPCDEAQGCLITFSVSRP